MYERAWCCLVESDDADFQKVKSCDIKMVQYLTLRGEAELSLFSEISAATLLSASASAKPSNASNRTGLCET